jgi:hypothetical protein
MIRRRARRSAGARSMRRYASCRRVPRLRRTRRCHPGRRLAPRANRRRGIDPRSDRLGFTSHPRRQVLSPPGHGLQAFPSVCWVRAEGRGLEPPNIQIRSGRHHRAGGGNARRSTAPAPQSEPVTHASRLVAQIALSVAVGLRAENPGRRASSRSTVLPLRPLCARTSRSLLGLVRGRGHRLIRRQRPGPSPTDLVRRGIMTETRHDETAMEIGISAHG